MLKNSPDFKAVIETAGHSHIGADGIDACEGLGVKLRYVLVVCQRDDIGCWPDIIDTRGLPRVFATDSLAVLVARFTERPIQSPSIA